jgi:hypothetical protein
MKVGFALAAMTAAVPAMACEYSNCTQPSWNYNYSGYHGHSQPACGIGAPCPVTYWRHGQLSQTEPYYHGTWPQYYYVNQGPTYTGPGMLAPTPTYQERAVSGWQGYGPTAYGVDYRYSGGPYGNATTHYYDGMPAATGPRIYSYQQAVVRRPTHFRPAPKPNPKINAGMPGHKIIQVN